MASTQHQDTTSRNLNAAVTYRDRPVTCPRCGLELSRREVGEVWTCGKCQGVLTGVGELVQELVATAPELVPPGGVGGITTIGRRSTSRSLVCPGCAGDMEPVFLGGVELDRCYQDELMWLDAGEQARVVAVARGQHAEREDNWLRRMMARWFGDAWS